MLLSKNRIFSNDLTLPDKKVFIEYTLFFIRNQYKKQGSDRQNFKKLEDWDLGDLRNCQFFEGSTSHFKKV